MSATAEQIERIRRMVAEPETANYSDTLLGEYIETYPLLDERGEQPYTWNITTEPPTKTANANWVPTYDLHAAAADIWEEKASTWADKYNFSADGASYSRSNAYEQIMARVRYHRSRRSSKTATLVKYPDEGTATNASAFPWIGNLPED